MLKSSAFPDQLSVMMKNVEHQVVLCLGQKRNDQAVAIISNFFHKVSTPLRVACSSDSLSLWLVVNLTKTFSHFGDRQCSHSLLLLNMMRRELWWYLQNFEALANIGNLSQLESREAVGEFYLKVVERIWTLARKWPRVVAGIALDVSESLLQTGSEALAVSWLRFAFSQFHLHDWTQLALSVRKMLSLCRQNALSTFHDLVWLSLNDFSDRTSHMRGLVELTREEPFGVVENYAIKVNVSIGKDVSLRILNTLSEPISVESLHLVFIPSPNPPDNSSPFLSAPAQFLSHLLASNTPLTSFPWPNPPALPCGQSLIETSFSFDHVGVFRLSHLDLQWNNTTLHLPVEDAVTVDNHPHVTLTWGDRPPLIGVVTDFDLTIDNSPLGVPVRVESNHGLLVEPKEFVLKECRNRITLMSLPSEDQRNECVVRNVVILVGDYYTKVEVTFHPLLTIQCSLHQSESKKKYVSAGVGNFLGESVVPLQNICVEVYAENGEDFRALNGRDGQSVFGGVRLNYVWEFGREIPSVFNISAFLSNDLAVKMWEQTFMKLNFIYNLRK